MTYEKGDVVLIPLAFVDDPTKLKKRPVLVIQVSKVTASDLNYILIIPITSNMRRSKYKCRVELRKDDPHYKASGLVQDSVLMIDQMRPIHPSDIIKVLGKMANIKLKTIDKSIKATLGIH